MKSFVALDFETANQHRSSVCSIGLVFVENSEIVDKYYELIQPVPNFYNYWNTKVHGLVYDDTANTLKFSKIWKNIIPKINGLLLVAHNSPFDEGGLKAVLTAYRLPTEKQSIFSLNFRIIS